jgi:hypothetical protein
MKSDEERDFLAWIDSLRINKSVAEELLPHMPRDADLDPEMGNWIESGPRIIFMNDPKRGFGLPKEPLDEGYLIIGSCPNGDLVAVEVNSPKLPVFYINHEQMHGLPLHQVIRKISDSINEYDEALSTEDSGIPMDYWDEPKKKSSNPGKRMNH